MILGVVELSLEQRVEGRILDCMNQDTANEQSVWPSKDHCLQPVSRVPAQRPVLDVLDEDRGVNDLDYELAVS